ncbi:hypothetical protein BDB00DRAFT_862833 [Zychaea mexicana]|uniref:uncharacterized protein n=1 Tax=Zychaea mexicana TaxID=64656 RepID=UPI0022FE702F|nr:uncharacterized protein BDB00DRAFT_862833 [Zychaea mexicana]KAI9470407.1 hypothetical protein BDB00DRAFT_862833 [Zychaea mexicana]
MESSSSSNPYRDYNDDELIQILENQRREHQRFYESGDIIDDIDHDDRHLGGIKRPPIPDMRFEPQFRKSVATMREQGATNAQIFFSAVIVNQFVMPFINGFSWSLLSQVWRWWRVRDATKVRSTTSSTSSFVRGMKYGIAKWFRNAYETFVHLPTLTQEPSGFARPANY